MKGFTDTFDTVRPFDVCDPLLGRVGSTFSNKMYWYELLGGGGGDQFLVFIFFSYFHPDGADSWVRRAFT